MGKITSQPVKEYAPAWNPIFQTILLINLVRTVTVSVLINTLINVYTT